MEVCDKFHQRLRMQWLGALRLGGGGGLQLSLGKKIAPKPKHFGFLAVEKKMKYAR